MAKKKSTIPADDLAVLGGQNAVTYGPQINQVRDLLQQADEQYKSDIEAAKGSAASAASVATAAIPKIIGLFAKSTENAQGSANTVNDLIRPTGATADVFRNALAREQGNVRDRITEGGAAAQTGLQNRVVAAEAGKQLAITQAGKARNKTRDTLTQRLADILQEQGATSAATLAGLRGDRSTAAAKDAAAQAKIDAQAGKDAAKERDKREKHLETVKTATGDYRNKIADAVTTWNAYLTKGIPVTKWTAEIDQQTGKPTGRQIEVPVLDKKTGQQVTRIGGAQEIRDAMLAEKDSKGHLKYTPGDIHIALLRNAGKTLDPEALRYLRNLSASGVRIPRAWLQPNTQAIDPHGVGGTPESVPGQHGHI